MTASDTKTNQLMVRKLQWLSQKQKIIANNVAHADTPSFTPGTIEDFKSAKTNSSERLRQSHTTHPRHIAITSHAAGGEYKVRQESNKTNHDVGNGVILEEEMFKVAETQNQYSELLNLYRRQQKMLNIALGK
jgi:flagellar basal-body rod protein FlgB